MEQIDSFIANVGERIINPLIILLFSLALVFFLYGVFQYIMNGENEEERDWNQCEIEHFAELSVGLGIGKLLWENQYDVEGECKVPTVNRETESGHRDTEEFPSWVFGEGKGEEETNSETDGKTWETGGRGQGFGRWVQ